MVSLLLLYFVSFCGLMNEGVTLSDGARINARRLFLWHTLKRMKKVLIFSFAYYPKHVGGAEVSVKNITDRISDIEFHVLTNRFDSTLPREEKLGNTYVHRIGLTTENPHMADLIRWPLKLNRYIYQLYAVWVAVRLHRRHHFDATWAVMAHSCGIPAALFKMLYSRVPFILNLQEGDPPEYVERIMRPVWPLFKRVFTSADMVQALSRYLADWARRRGAKGDIEIIPNAVDAAHFAKELPPRVVDEVRDELGKHMGDVCLITTSRLVHKNAIDDVISALPKLPKQVKFIVLGTGSLEENLKQQVKKMNLEGRVRFVGKINNEEIPKYLHACDIFIRPSRSEGFGSSFVEAMAAGLPVIATQEGGIADFLFDERRNPEMPITGWAVDKNSPEQIASAVQDIMAHSEKVRAVVRTAREMVFEKYDWDIIAQDMRKKVFGRLFASH